ncbi:MAG: DUF4956 domain-containing protein [Pirellulales bacterium]|nr:DUF4956 domain-containing protein [Pirellulales bacterium]
MDQIQQAFDKLRDSVALGDTTPILSLTVYLFTAGALALIVRLLYRKCSGSPSDTESLSRVFPLLAIVTTGVIAVVKSSLALSLGLVGALSIVRFRAAIKDPEELVYLFLCIAIGLALGAEQPLLAITFVAVATVFIVGMRLTSGGMRRQRLMLTITGEAAQCFPEDGSSINSAVESVVGKYSLQRFDVENGRAQIRLVLGEMNAKKSANLIAKLQNTLPECDVSYVNLNSSI